MGSRTAKQQRSDQVSETPNPTQQQPSHGVEQRADDQTAVTRPKLREVWQLPALIVAMAALIAGVGYAVLRAPKPTHADAFAEADRFFATEKYGEAIDSLNRKVLPHLRKNEISPDLRRKYHLMVARSLGLGQRALNLEREENNKGIVTQFTEAERRNATLEAQDVVMLAEALLGLGRIGDAVKRAESLPDSAREERNHLYKRVVRGSIDSPVPNTGLALDLIGKMGSDSGLSVADRAWLAARQAEILLAQGYAAEAVSKTLRAMARLVDAPASLRGELFTLLARGYFETGGLSEAQSHLDRARENFDPNDPRLALVDLLAGKIELLKDKAKAEERFTSVVARFDGSNEAVEALLGLAEVEALLDKHEEALADYTDLAERIRSGKAPREVSIERVTESLLTNFRSRMDVAEYETAIRYGEIAESLHGGGNAPASVAIALAEAHRRLGEEILHAAAPNEAISLAQADPATQAIARGHFIRGADYYRQHADRVVLTDNDAYGSSVWSSADLFDRAGDLEEASQGFMKFVEGFPADQRLPEARFRLAQILHARGELGSAERIYREIIAGRESALSAGPFADASYVPLARVLLADSDPANDGEAEEKLVTVVSGALGGPATENYRDAVDELSKLYYSTGRYEEAIAQLDEYIARYGERKSRGVDEKAAAALSAARFRLADSHRLAAAALRARLQSSDMPDTERRALDAARTSHLRSAMAAYDVFRDRFNTDGRRTALQELNLRNALFYLGDCAFELGDYELAIRRYDEAKEQHPGDPASLVAMVQIVSAHLKQGDTQRAATANARARRFFESLPETVWDDPMLPMTRVDWERWLEANDQLTRATLVGAEGNRRDGG